MKDLVENRSRMSLRSKIRLLLLTLKENGLLYTGLLGAYYAGSTVSDFAFATMQDLRKKRGLPGLNSRGLNAEIWDKERWQTRSRTIDSNKFDELMRELDM